MLPVLYNSRIKVVCIIFLGSLNMTSDNLFHLLLYSCNSRDTNDYETALGVAATYLTEMKQSTKSLLYFFKWSLELNKIQK